MKTMRNSRRFSSIPFAVAIIATGTLLACASLPASSEENTQIWWRCAHWDAAVFNGREYLGAELVDLKETSDGTAKIFTGTIIPYLIVDGQRYYVQDASLPYSPLDAELYQAKSGGARQELRTEPRAEALPLPGCNLERGEVVVRTDRTTNAQTASQFLKVRYFKHFGQSNASTNTDACRALSPKPFLVQGNTLVIGEGWRAKDNTVLDNFEGFVLGCTVEGKPADRPPPTFKRYPKLSMRYEGVNVPAQPPASVNLFAEPFSLSDLKGAPLPTGASAGLGPGYQLATMADVVELFTARMTTITDQLAKTMRIRPSSVSIEQVPANGQGQAAAKPGSQRPGSESQSPTSAKQGDQKASPPPVTSGAAGKQSAGVTRLRKYQVQSDLPTQVLTHFRLGNQAIRLVGGQAMVELDAAAASEPLTLSYGKLCSDSVPAESVRSDIIDLRGGISCRILTLEGLTAKLAKGIPQDCAFESLSNGRFAAICPPKATEVRLGEGWLPITLAALPTEVPNLGRSLGLPFLRPVWKYADDPIWTASSAPASECAGPPVALVPASVRYCAGSRCSNTVPLVPLPQTSVSVKSLQLPSLVEAGWTQDVLPGTVQVNLRQIGQNNSNTDVFIRWQINNADIMPAESQIDKRFLSMVPLETTPIRVVGKAVPFDFGARIALYQDMESCRGGGSARKEYSFDAEAVQQMKGNACMYARVRNGSRPVTLCTKVEAVGTELQVQLQPKEFGNGMRNYVVIEETAGYGTGRDAILQAVIRWAESLHKGVRDGTKRSPMTLLHARSDLTLETLFDAEDLQDLPLDADRSNADSVRGRLSRLVLQETGAAPLAVLQEADIQLGKKLRNVLLITATRLPDRPSAGERGLPLVWQKENIRLTVLTTTPQECQRWKGFGAGGCEEFVPGQSRLRHVSDIERYIQESLQ